VTTRVATVRCVAGSLLLLAASVIADAQSWKNTAPESFRANGQILGAAGGAASAIDIKIDRYSTDAEMTPMAAALKSGGNDAFLAELKKGPAIGTVKVGTRSIPVRWARQEKQGEGRRVVLVTDGPVYFAGAGAIDAKPTAGYDLAVIEFVVDSVGLGKGSMAPAARVKAGGSGGVEIDDYSGKRVTLTTVTRNVS
jgi:hypothetical protein